MSGDRIKLLKFISVFAIGGTERQFVNVVQRLDLNKFDVHLACFKRWGEFLGEIEACARPLTDYTINSLASYRTLQQQWRFASYLRKHRIQVVHTYGFYPNLFAIPAAKMAGVPVTIAAIRDTGAHISPLQQRAQRVICAMADCVLVNASAVEEWLVGQGYRRDKIRIIRNGIIFTPADSPSGIRQEFALPGNARLIGVICRLYAAKGVQYFVEAAASVAARFDDVRFLIVGDGTEKAVLQAQAERLGIERKVIFTGFRTDTSKILSELSMSVLPSLTEGLSNTLLESMAAGVPVVATRVGGNPEIIVDGETGILVPSRNSEALAHAMCQLLEKPELADTMGRAGKQRIADHFSVEQTVRQTEHLYSDLLSRIPA